MKAWKITDKDGNNQISFKRPKYQGINCEELEIPCGKCIGCKLDHANDWATRCWCEMQSWKNNCFITLTYNDKHLPKNGYLNKKHIQLFMKKLRYYQKGIESWKNPISGKTENPIRFLLCGEYGPNGTRRPHYHLLIFNWKPQEKLKFYKENHNGDRLFISKTITKIWGKGFTTIGDLNYKSACYVSRYCTKKMFNVKNNELKAAKIQPEFILMSRNGGIGIKYWNEYQKAILERDGILIKTKDKVKNKRIPKYFERKYKEQNESEFKKYQDKKIIKGKINMKKILENTSMTESDYKLMLERQLLEKNKLLRRNNII